MSLWVVLPIPESEQIYSFVHATAKETMDQINTKTLFHTPPFNKSPTFCKRFPTWRPIQKNMQVRDGMSFALMFDPTTSWADLTLHSLDCILNGTVRC